MAENYETFGNFILLKKRSEDGLGSLWRAGEMERTGFKRIAWLRRFDHSGLDRAALQAELGIAGQLAPNLKATNIARNAYYGAEDDVPYTAWDFAPGQPLDELLARVAMEHFPVAIDNALLITEKIAAALNAALAVEIRGEALTHGFLVPHMVLVGNDGEAMVNGFGLARGLLANLDRVEVHELAAPYLAPEVLTTAGASRRSDVYSLGAILYQLLTGVALPAEAEARPAALEAPQLALDEGPVPADILAILKRSLAPRAEDRYSSAADFKRDLEKLLYGGAYSPTTFNLALFMDRLYRQDIEDEDKEIQKEKGIDVPAYYSPPKGAGEVVSATQAAPSSRLGLWVALGAVIVLLAVVAFLLWGRQSQPAVDTAAQEQRFAALLDERLAAQEQQLQQALEAERATTAELRKQLDGLQKVSDAGRQRLSPEEQRKLDEARQQLAAREAEQRRMEEQLASVQQKRQAPEVVATAQPAAPTAAPTRSLALVPTAVPEPAEAEGATTKSSTAPGSVAPGTKPEVPAAVPTAATSAIGLGKVQQGAEVDYTMVDVAPEVLVQDRLVLPQAAIRAARAKGVVILSAHVTDAGTVDDVKVLRPFPVGRLGVDEAVVAAVMKYRFRPALKDGVRVKTWVTVTVPVDLTRR